MANVKTAISVEKSLFSTINSLTKDMNISRSHFFVLAAKDYIQKIKNKNLFDCLNKAYDNSPDQTEKEVLKGMSELQKDLIGDKW